MLILRFCVSNSVVLVFFIASLRYARTCQLYTNKINAQCEDLTKQESLPGSSETVNGQCKAKLLTPGQHSRITSSPTMHSPTMPGLTMPSPTIPGPTMTSPAMPGPTIPGPTMTSPTMPGPTMTSPTMPGLTMPSPTMPGPTMPNPTMSSPTMPGPTIPSPTMHNPTMHGPTMPSPTMPGPTMPNRVMHSPSVEDLKPKPSNIKEDLKLRVLRSLNLLEAPKEFNTRDIPNDHYAVEMFRTFTYAGKRTAQDDIALFPTEVANTEQDLTLSFQLDHLPKYISEENIKQVRVYIYSSGTKHINYTLTPGDYSASSSPRIFGTMSVERWDAITIGKEFFKWDIESRKLPQKIIIRCGPINNREKCKVDTNKNKTPFLTIEAKQFPTNQEFLVSDNSSVTCSKQSVNVNVAAIGWDKWLLHPKSYIHTYCLGFCDKSFGDTPVQSCLPHTLPMRFVYWQNNVVISHTVSEMLVKQCDCMLNVNNDPSYKLSRSV